MIAKLLMIIGLGFMIYSFVLWLYELINQTPEEYIDIKESIESEELQNGN